MRKEVISQERLQKQSTIQTDLQILHSSPSSHASPVNMIRKAQIDISCEFEIRKIISLGRTYTILGRYQKLLLPFREQHNNPARSRPGSGRGGCQMRPRSNLRSNPSWLEMLLARKVQLLLGSAAIHYGTAEGQLEARSAVAGFAGRQKVSVEDGGARGGLRKE